MARELKKLLGRSRLRVTETQGEARSEEGDSHQDRSTKEINPDDAQDQTCS